MQDIRESLRGRKCDDEMQRLALLRRHRAHHRLTGMCSAYSARHNMTAVTVSE